MTPSLTGDRGLPLGANPKPIKTLRQPGDTPRAPRRVLFLIRGLHRGGSERQLVTVAKGLCERGLDVGVAVFYPGGPLERDLSDTRVRLHNLEKRSRWDIPGFTARLARLLRDVEPDIVHSYLPVANIVAALLKPVFPAMHLVWGVRASNMNLSRYDWLSGFSYRLEAGLARFADLIIANSHAGRDHVVAKGFPGARTVVIPNGVDTDRFLPNQAGRRRVRGEWELTDEDILVGLVGRLDPMKGHPTFLEAAASLAPQIRALQFVCVGDGSDEYSQQLRELGNRLGLQGRLRWVGERADMCDVFNALDIACSASSYGEGFSNSIGEAMACERVCVATDVGDSARIVGDTGIVIPPDDPQGLAEGLRAILALSATERRALGSAARRRITQEYSGAALIERTFDALMALP